MNVRVIPLLGILLLGTAAAGAAQNRLPSIPQTLSLEDALGLAERYNPTYLQTANDRGPAAWGVRNAYAAFIPSLTATSSATSKSGSRGIRSLEVLRRISSRLVAARKRSSKLPSSRSSINAFTDR